MCFKPFAKSFLAAVLMFSANQVLAAFPDKPITLYVAFSAGGTTDITARALAQGAEKILGVPITIENKGGGGATVANGLVATKKPDGYNLLATSTGSITVRPLLVKLAYTPKDFRVLIQYTSYIGGLVVRADAPYKDVQEFITYAKAHPGMTYASSGPHTQQQVGVESFARCNGLTFKHMPTKGGANSNTALLGSHVDFIAGSGSHLPYIEQGQFKELIIFHQDERDPGRKDIPVMKDINCPPTNPPNGMIIVSPAGLPDAIADKLSAAFKQVADSAEFKALLVKYNLPDTYMSGPEVQKGFPAEIEWYRKYFSDIGMIKP
jgi:tripartite-type tricarboxylate transporter receptor subunit TctC